MLWAFATVYINVPMIRLNLLSSSLVSVNRKKALRKRVAHLDKPSFASIIAHLARSACSKTARSKLRPKVVLGTSRKHFARLYVQGQPKSYPNAAINTILQ